MRRKLFIWFLICWGAFSCAPEDRPHGSLRIVFETGSLQTKADDPDGVVADGGGIYINEGTPDLVILIANSSGDIVATYPDSGRGGIITGNVEGTPAATQMSVSFMGLTGNVTYSVYAFANTQGLWTMKSGGTTVSSLTGLTSETQVEGLQFEPVSEDLDADSCLKVKNSRLPLSAKGAVTLHSSGNGEISLALLRCVAKVTAVFENQYGSELTLYNFSNTLFHMRPETGYVIPHSSDFAVAYASEGSLVTSETDPLTINKDDVVSKSWFVFPSLGPYTCNVSFKLTSSGEPLSYTDLPVHDDHARDIPQLARNQHLTITTRIGKGQSVSFNFEVANWGGKTETVTFN